MTKLVLTKKEAPQTRPSMEVVPWKILVVDDDQEVHAVTRLALNSFRFEGRGVEILSAFSAAEARSILASEGGVAVVLLDVVMETDDAGLRLVHYIRDDLKSHNTRIILRTGQPGQAPEQEVIVKYDINDYKAKTELTVSKLFTTLVAAIRTFEKMRELDVHRAELEQRVRERTLDLQVTNNELRAEIELRKQAEERLRIYAEVIHSTGEAVAITDHNRRLIEVNPAFETMIGQSRLELIGASLYEFDEDPECDRRYQELWCAVESHGRWTGEILDRRWNGESFPVWVSANIMRDEEGKPLHYVTVSRDITPLKQNELQLQQLAFYDTLTRLPNRALFNDRLHIALASTQRHGGVGALIYLDLDRFKYVNDTLGHPAGDRLLIDIGLRLGHCIRAADIIARMGGDEFTILLTHLVDESEAVQVAERIHEALEKPISLDNEIVHVGASIGISIFPRDGNDAAAILKYADMAMYEAKEAGRGQHRVFRSEMLGRAGERLSMNAQIEAALVSDEFSLVYQPIINLVSGNIESVEALIRWHRSDGQTMLPMKFIPHAEESGLIKQIDYWVLDRACHDAARWLEAGRQLSVCVNLSPISVQQPNMAHIVDSILKRANLPAKLLNLEVTETAVISDPNSVRKVLDEIVALGVGLSLDDFGTGYSSLSYITRFPINCIKLDRMFIDRIGKDKASEEVIESLLELARKLNLRVVAEGIELSNQQTFLENAGCNFMQGFHFAKPMPDTQLLPWLTSQGSVLAEGMKHSVN